MPGAFLCALAGGHPRDGANSVLRWHGISRLAIPCKPQAFDALWGFHHARGHSLCTRRPYDGKDNFPAGAVARPPRHSLQTAGEA